MTGVRFVAKSGKTEHGVWKVVLDGDHVKDAGPDPDPAETVDVTFTVDPGEVDAIRSGELRVSVGFMRGQIKMAGDYGALLEVLGVLDSDEFAPSRARLFG